jgi:Pilus formation protein N terminal region
MCRTFGTGCLFTRSTTATWHDLVIAALVVLGAAALLPLLGVAAKAGDPSHVIVVQLDQARLISLPKVERTIVVDDPRIAGVTELPDSNRAVVTGFAFGETRMTVLTRDGDVVAKSTIRVTEASGTGVTVYRGVKRSTYYDCARLCQPRLRLGDTGDVDISGQIRSRDEEVMRGLAKPQPDVAAKPPSDHHAAPKDKASHDGT